MSFDAKMKVHHVVYTMLDEDIQDFDKGPVEGMAEKSCPFKTK